MLVSSDAAKALSCVAAGRRAPAGGIRPLRSLRITFSQVSAFSAGLVTSILFNASPPDFRRSLWQPTQY